jgi:hypothetical protein
MRSRRPSATDPDGCVTDSLELTAANSSDTGMPRQERAESPSPTRGLLYRTDRCLCYDHVAE